VTLVKWIGHPRVAGLGSLLLRGFGLLRLLRVPPGEIEGVGDGG
jgi:hypothetical protein